MARPPRWSWSDLMAMGVLMASVAWVFREVLFGGRTLFYFDISEINYPYRDFLASEWRAGRFSRWHPGLYCGMALFSESQAGYFHFLKPLYLFLPTWRAFGLDTGLSVALTALATYGWLRRHVGRAGALTGAAVFGLGGFVWAHIFHTSMINAMISVPVALWGLESAWEGGRLRGAVLGAVALAMQVFAGHLQDSLLTGTLIGLYATYRAATESGFRSRAFALAAGVLLVGLGVAIAAIQWVPSKELIDRSPRAAGIPWDELTYGSWHPELLPTMAIREAYGSRARDTDWMDGYYPYHEMNTYLGLIALGLAVVGAAAYRDRWVGFWVLIAGISFAAMLGRYTILFDHMTDVPFIGRGRIPVRYHLWFSMAIACLGAVGVDRLTRPGMVRLRWAFAAMLGLILLSAPILYITYEPAWTQTYRWNTSYNQKQFIWLREDLVVGAVRLAILGGTGALVAWGASNRPADRPRSRARLAGLLPVLVIIDLVAAHRHEVPTMPPSYWETPPASAALIDRDSEAIRVVGFQERSLAEPGYASGDAAHFQDVFNRSRELLSYSTAPVWGLRSAEGVTPIIPTRYLAYGDNVLAGAGRYEIESVTHLISTHEKLIGMTPSRAAGSVFVHSNPKALPRARLVGRPIYTGDRPESVRAARRIGAGIRDRLIVEDPARPLSEDATPVGAASIVVDLPERVEVDVEADSPAYLFLADTFDPGWSATLDDRPVAIHPAQINFRAVLVPEGSHRIAFRYEPAGFQRGLAITAAGLIFGALAFAWPWRGVSLKPTHGPSGWPRWWPAAFLALLAALCIGSALVRPPTGESRWGGSWHAFTWGAGIGAMRPAPPPIE
ncbi:MAG: YfhO family protein [Isosphaeraceae bacterium]